MIFANLNNSSKNEFKTKTEDLNVVTSRSSITTKTNVNNGLHVSASLVRRARGQSSAKLTAEYGKQTTQIANISLSGGGGERVLCGGEVVETGEGSLTTP